MGGISQTGDGPGARIRPEYSEVHWRAGTENAVKRAAHDFTPVIALGPADRRSFAGALVGAAIYFTLAYLSVSLSRFDSSLATVWPPSASAVAFLLCTRLSNELPFYIAVLIASMLANVANATPVDLAIVFSIANLATVGTVTWLTRRGSGPLPDMTQLGTLARFVWVGGLIGPITGASLAATGLSLSGSSPGGAAGPDWPAIWEGASAWFLVESLGMVLIVPTVLLIVDKRGEIRPGKGEALLERGALLASSIACVFLVFSQNAFPLLFLITPITLLHAFRLGSAGTALHVALVALVATAMTWAGLGPIVEASELASVRLLLIQAFIAANFLTGLPVAAILAGRDRLTDELTAGRRELSLLADNITDAVLKLDANGVCTYASPSVRDVLGRDPEEFIGARINERTHEDASDRIAVVLERLLSGQSDKERLTYRRLLDDEDAMPVFIEADCAIALDPLNGEREGVVVSARDVTERVELELLLTRARRHAENAANAKSNFLANMSHEIRTPMNGVLGFAELILQGELDPEQRRHTEMIVESGRSMMLLLNDVLDLSKIEAGQIAIETAPIDLHATLEECVALHRLTAKRKGLSIHLKSETDRGLGDHSENALNVHDETRLAPSVMTDGLRLRQIVLNLVGNAVKFTESGEVHVCYRVSVNELCVQVRDTGIGISASRLDTIFRPFTQGESDTMRRFGGTGLGLSISRQLAQLLGGVIEVESEPGVGSTFTLTLPTALAAAQEAPAAKPAPIIPDDLPQHARILLAEDHDVNRLLVTEMLKRCGQSVAIAHEGNEAISMVIDSVMRGRPYDLVLMDVQMPQCDGYSATQAIRNEGIGPDTLPIIALTANAFPEDVAAARAAGMQAHLAKPIVFADLAQALQRWLPTRIVETPMDRDIALIDPEDSGDADAGGIAETGAGTGTGKVMELARNSAALIGRAGEDDGAHTSPDSAAVQASKPKSAADYGEIPLHSPRLFNRWLKRRREAIEAVREALANGVLGEAAADENAALAQRDELKQLLHKLAGTAGTFGEPELGQQACELEEALRKGAAASVSEALAFGLLALADEPAGVTSPAKSSQR